ncbi:MAG: hypothetical protein JSV11_04005 [Nitrospiraceae bacterium]|nr:MAG: hypothetical protein JSV11_04005 [Nitrospiraceae bacterium]
MKTFVCSICGHISFEYAPVECPVCGMSIENFDNDPAVIKIPPDPANLTDLEKKHIPQIVIDKQCSLIEEGCINVSLMVGAEEHVMESEHFIKYIDFYLDTKYVSRFVLTPKLIHPAACFHMNMVEGKIAAIAHCNVHGNWMTELDLQQKEH